MQTIGISGAEWQVMRIVWTLKRCTSRQLIKILNRQHQWRASTVKTLLMRLRKKKILNGKLVKNRYVYSANVDEQQAANDATLALFKNICPMHAGRAINSLLKQIVISRGDVQTLIRTLRDQEPNAPRRVKCNCLSLDSQKEVNCRENER